MANLKKEAAGRRDWRAWSDPKNDDVLVSRGELKQLLDLYQQQLMDILDQKAHPWRYWWNRKRLAWSRRARSWLARFFSAPASASAVAGPSESEP